MKKEQQIMNFKSRMMGVVGETLATMDPFDLDSIQDTDLQDALREAADALGSADGMQNYIEKVTQEGIRAFRGGQSDG